jgi:hypothetical protein
LKPEVLQAASFHQLTQGGAVLHGLSAGRHLFEINGPEEIVGFALPGDARNHESSLAGRTFPVGDIQPFDHLVSEQEMGISADAFDVDEGV